MSVRVADLLDITAFSVEVVGKCNGEYVDDIWDDKYLYCRVTDVYIDTVRDYGRDKTVLVIEFQEAKVNG